MNITRLFAAVIFLAALGFGGAHAAQLKPGEYACAGSGGRILIGLGFKLLADGTYTDLDGKTSGRLVYQGSSVTFVGGHLAGEVGRNVTATNLDIHSASCSVN